MYVPIDNYILECNFTVEYELSWARSFYIFDNLGAQLAWKAHFDMYICNINIMAKVVHPAYGKGNLIQISQTLWTPCGSNEK